MRLRGSLDGRGLRVAVVVARFNELVTRPLADGCRDELERLSVTDVDWVDVPGARELPLACKALAATGRYVAIVAIGCVVRGETAHFEYVAGEASTGCGRVSLDAGIPVVFGVLTPRRWNRRLDRAGGKSGNKGREAAITAVEMATLLEGIGKADDSR